MNYNHAIVDYPKKKIILKFRFASLDQLEAMEKYTKENNNTLHKNDNFIYWPTAQLKS